ncbi:MAG: tetratricopeptide repeat protein [Vicinamibacterales bacterium]|nr:tetratricopeptide repeat protein [Vicinamibacterales bacterium]
MPVMPHARLVLLLVGLLVPVPVVRAQTPAAPATPAARPAGGLEAYYQFMLARRLDGEGHHAAALAALERARTLDPSSAEIVAEIAAHHARQNRAAEAVTAAEAALVIDPANGEANRVLGLVYAAYAEGVVPPPPGTREADWLPRAIARLKAIEGTPAMATELGLQLTLGRLYVRAGQADEAVAVLDAVASQAPYLTEPFLLLAEAHTARNRITEATEAMGGAARANPRYYATLGDLFEQQRRWPEAAEAYQRALDESRGQNRDVRLRLAAALLNVPEGAGSARAEALLTEHLAANGSDGRALYLLAQAYRVQGNTQSAEATARRLLALDPTNVSALYVLSLSLFDRHDYQGVVDTLEPFAGDAAARSQGREGDGALLLAQLGTAHQRLGAHDAAVMAFRRGRELRPDMVDYASYVVQALIAAGRVDEAETEAARALEQFPRSLRLRQLRAQALVRGGRADDGLAIMEDLAASRPGDRDALFALVDAYTEAKRFDAAVARLDQAIAAAPDVIDFHFKLGAVQESAGRVPEAERAFRAVLTRDPLHAPALNYLGYMLADRGLRLPEALALIERALVVDPENPSYLDSLGWTLFKMGRVQEAEAPLRKAAAVMTDSSVVQDHLGDLLARRRQWAAAVEAWERALAGDRESVDVAAIERKIRDARRRR